MRSKQVWVVADGVGRLLLKDREVLVDEVDVARVSKRSWHYCPSRRNKNGYVKSQAPTRVSLHRFILGLTDKRILCDHINGDALDCRRANLRECNARENRLNSVIKSTSSRQYVGVVSSKNCFYAHVKLPDGTYQEGARHTLAVRAAVDRDNIMREHYGSGFPRFNFPRQGERSIFPPSHVLYRTAV